MTTNSIPNSPPRAHQTTASSTRTGHSSPSDRNSETFMRSRATSCAQIEPCSRLRTHPTFRPHRRSRPPDELQATLGGDPTGLAQCLYCVPRAPSLLSPTPAWCWPPPRRRPRTDASDPVRPYPSTRTRHRNTHRVPIAPGPDPPRWEMIPREQHDQRHRIPHLHTHLAVDFAATGREVEK